MKRYIKRMGLLLCCITAFGCACTCAGKRGMAGNPASAQAEQSRAASGVPTGLRLTVAPTGVELFWTPPADSRQTVSGYEIVRGTYLSGPFSPVGTVDGSTHGYIDTTAAPEHIYYYKVRALTPAGPTDFSIPATAEISGTPAK